MATQATHIHFVKEEYYKHPTLFNKIDLSHAYFGSILADIYYVKLYGRKKANFGVALHTNNFGLKLAKKLFDDAHNYKERSFALGFASHFILDKYIHGYLIDIGMFNRVEHMTLEFFLEAEVAREKNEMVIKRYPKALFKRTLKKDFPQVYNKYKKELHVYFPKLMLYKFANDVVFRYMLTSKYLHRYPKKNIFLDFFLKVCYYAPLKSYDYRINTLIYPHYYLKERYLSEMLKMYALAQKEFHEFMLHLPKPKHIIDNLH